MILNVFFVRSYRLNVMTLYFYVLDLVFYVILECGWIILIVGWLLLDNFFINIRMVVGGQRKGVYFVKYFFYKRRDMNLNLQSLQKKFDKVVCICDFSNGEIGVRVFWQILGVYWLVIYFFC